LKFWVRTLVAAKAFMRATYRTCLATYPFKL
jgi:hypothetical protein